MYHKCHDHIIVLWNPTPTKMKTEDAGIEKCNLTKISTLQFFKGLCRIYMRPWILDAEDSPLGKLNVVQRQELDQSRV